MYDVVGYVSGDGLVASPVLASAPALADVVPGE